MVSCAEVDFTVTSTKVPMRLLILGATGGTGRALLEQARTRGHQVTAFVRSPQKLGPPQEGVTVRRGDPLSVTELRAVLPDHDAVLTALGPPGPGRTTILRDFGRSIVEAMRDGGPRCLLVVSVAALFDDAGFVASLFRRTLLRNIVVDAAEMERAVMESGLDWTIARPPRLTNGPLTRLYRVADGRMPRGRVWVSRADVAHFLLDELEQSRHVHEIVGMAGGNGRGQK
jgi:putative NADH-flavin reductase